MHRCLSVLLAFGLLAAATPTRAEVKTPASPVKAALELSQQFYYAGDPFFVRVAIGNDGDKDVKNPVKTPLFQGLKIKRAGGADLEAKGKPDVAEPSRPEMLTSKAFYGTIVDAAKIYPDLQKPGAYELRFAADGLESDTLVVRIIPKYDPQLDYRARIETDQGAFTLEFFRDRSPIAVKAFVDMANAGFYDGLLLNEIRADWLVAGGDPFADNSGRVPFRFPQELSSTPVVAGTVILRPVAAAPPSNSSPFVVMLRPEPSYTGQVTVLGQVVEGLDVVQKLSRLPSSQTATKPFYKPLKDIRIVKVSVSEKTPAAKP
jgi:cyclophilin family peptidyl-prolyl cis-trans isomerase